MSNYGIMDQMAVLQWVQENIVQFGGDPQRVTLFGHGTGAACIEYLTHSPTTVPGKPEYLIAIAQCVMIVLECVLQAFGDAEFDRGRVMLLRGDGFLIC